MALIGAFFASPVQAQYIYEADQDLYDLTGHSGTTNLGVGDDSISAQFNFHDNIHCDQTSASVHTLHSSHLVGSCISSSSIQR